MLNGLTPEQQRLRDYDREWGLRSTFYLGKRILGYQLDPQPHREMCAFLDDKTRKHKLELAPRGGFKTSVASQVYVIRRIIENPNIRILLDSVALSNSQDNLRVSRRAFEGHEKLRELYGDFRGKMEPWNDTEYTVSRRTNMKLREPTVRAAGIDKIQIGPHYDLIIGDDLHNMENSKSADQIEKVKQHIRLAFGLLDPGGEFMIIGHRWNYTDAYSMVMGDTNKPEELEFSKVFKDAMLIRSAIYPDGSLYFPRVLNREHLARQRTTLGPEKYAAMLMNEPVVAGEGSKFSIRYFKRYKEPLQTKNEVTHELAPKLNWYLTVDVGGAKKGNDYWVIFEGAIDAAGNKYFVRYLKKLSKPTTAAEDIYKWWKQRLHQKIGFEIAGQQEQILSAIKDYLWATHKEALPFKDLVRPPRESKDERVEAMGPEYEMGKIFHSEQMSEPYGLEDQLLKWGKQEKDVADAAAMLREVARAPRVTERERQPASLDEMIIKQLQEEEKDPHRMRRVHPILGSDY